MALNKTEKILISGYAVSLVLAIAAYLVPRMADLRLPLWAVYAGFHSSLMLCLRVESGIAGLTATTSMAAPGPDLTPLPQSQASGTTTATV